MTKPSDDHRIEGEGSYRGAAQYQEGARAFARSGRVGEAARRARQDVDRYGARLRLDELRARSRAREFDPALRNPSWWTDEHESSWARVKEALRRDWEQTKSHLWPGRGTDLDQNLVDTVKQAAGKEPIPPAGQPNPTDEDWAIIEPYVRHGYGAAMHRSGRSWDSEVDDDVRSGLSLQDGDPEWDRARGFIIVGYSLYCQEQDDEEQGEAQPIPRH